MSTATLAIAVAFALRSPFDEQHQRRVFVLSSYNVRDFSLPRCLGLFLMLGLLNWVLHQLSTHKTVLHVGAADGAPGFEQLVDDIAADFAEVGAQSVQEDMHDWNGDWDVLYPFSAVSGITSSSESRGFA